MNKSTLTPRRDIEVLLGGDGKHIAEIVFEKLSMSIGSATRKQIIESEKAIFNSNADALSAVLQYLKQRYLVSYCEKTNAWSSNFYTDSRFSDYELKPCSKEASTGLLMVLLNEINALEIDSLISEHIAKDLIKRCLGKRFKYPTPEKTND